MEVTAIATATPLSAVVGVQFRLDGAALGGEDLAPPYAVTWDAATATVGSHALSAVARTDTGASATSVTVTVTVAAASSDSTPPTTPSSVRATPLGPDRVSLRWDAATDDVGVSNYRIVRDGLQAGVVSGTFFVDTGLAPETTYSYAVQARDAAGNASPLSSPVTVTTAAVGAATSLANLAATMAPGSWAELTTVGYDWSSLLMTPRSANTIFAYSEEVVWDSVSRQLFFLGSGHGDTVGQFIHYADATNSWSVLPRQPFTADISMHAYDHQAIDSTRGYYYHRYASVVHRYEIGTGAWDTLPAMSVPVLSYYGALEYFPERDSLLFVNGRGGDGANLGQLYEHTSGSNDWPRVGNNLPMGEYHNFAEYNPVHRLVLFGGGDGAPGAIHIHDAAGVITRKGDAPVGLGVTHAVVTVDPVSGAYLVFGSGGAFYAYDVIGDRWTLEGGHALIDQFGYLNTVATPLSNYGVVLLLKFDFESSQVLLYKHHSG